MPELIINGLKVVSSIYVADIGHVKRSWRERLFERPWRPCKSHKSIYEPRVYMVNEVAMVSPQTFCMIEQAGFLDSGVITGPLHETLMAKRALTKGKK